MSKKHSLAKFCYLVCFLSATANVSFKKSCELFVSIVYSLIKGRTSCRKQEWSRFLVSAAGHSRDRGHVPCAKMGTCPTEGLTLHVLHVRHTYKVNLLPWMKSRIFQFW